MPGSIISLKIVSAHAVKHIVIFEPILRFSRSSLFETSKETKREYEIKCHVTREFPRISFLNPSHGTLLHFNTFL